MQRDLWKILSMLALLIAPLPGLSAASARPAKVKYAKTEVEKAQGKCVGLMVGGTIVGGLLGALAGKKHVGTGAGLGLTAGGVACAIVMDVAKRKDRIIAAQIAAAMYQDSQYETVLEAANENEQPVTFRGSGGQSQTIDAQQLRPVRYASVGGGKTASPVLDTGGQECRYVNSSITNAAGQSTDLPAQLFCRSGNDWHPYGLAKA